MKKSVLAALVCALAIGALLAGCGSGNGEQTVTVSKYAFDLNGVAVAVNADMAPLAEALGEPSGYFESESCAFQGLDKVYTYGGVIIRTYPQDGKDYVLSVELKDDTVPTREGVTIGADRQDVLAAYGQPGDETAGALRYVDGDCTLAFIFTDDTVTGITYTSDAA